MEQAHGGAAVGVRAHPCFLEVMLWLLWAEWLSQDWLCLGVFHVPPLMCIRGNMQAVGSGPAGGILGALVWSLMTVLPLFPQSGP